MHDIKWIRDNPEAFDAAMKARGLEPQAESLIALDEKRRHAITQLNEMQAERNEVAKQIGEKKRAGEDASEVMARAGKLKEDIAALEAELETGGELTHALERLPNIPLADVPEGQAEEQNVEVARWAPDNSRPSSRGGSLAPPPAAGSPSQPPPQRGGGEFTPKQHFEIGEALGLMDFETAAKMSGSRFVILSGALARLERALASFMLDLHTDEFGYQETVPPYLVRDNALYGTGQLPKFEEDLYKTSSVNYDETFFDEFTKKILHSLESSTANQAEIKLTSEMLSAFIAKNRYDFIDDFIEIEVLPKRDRQHWLIPTAEVSLTNIVADSILEAQALPHRYTAYTPCFRSEAGSAGRDTRGMIRQHQFSKVELVSIVRPEEGETELERLTGAAEEVLKRLELPYRKMLLCSGDMGFSARKTYDLEVWLPGQGQYREISSCSYCGDFQARRMKARFRREGEKKTEFLHTLNGSGLAIGRTIVAILENYQQPDGSVKVPDALVPYMGGLKKIT